MAENLGWLVTLCPQSGSREMDAVVYLAFFFSRALGPQRAYSCLPYLGSVSTPLSIQSTNFPIDVPRDLSPRWFLSSCQAILTIIAVLGRGSLSPQNEETLK